MSSTPLPATVTSPPPPPAPAQAVVADSQLQLVQQAVEAQVHPGAPSPVPRYYLPEVLEPAGQPVQVECPAPQPETRTQQAVTAIADLLLDNSAALKKPKGTALQPHLFVTRGDACKAIGLGVATWPEDFETLKVMAASPSLPPNWAQYITKHETELV